MRTLTDSRGVEYESGHSWPHHDKLEGLCPDDLDDYPKINWTAKYPSYFPHTLRLIAEERDKTTLERSQRLQDWLDAGNTPWWGK